MINPKYIILDVSWIRSLEKNHAWFNSKYEFRKILETFLTKSDYNVNMLLLFDEKELIWADIENTFDERDLEKIDIDYLGKIIDDIICKFYLDLSCVLKEDNCRDRYIFYKWLDDYSLMLERDDDD